MYNIDTEEGQMMSFLWNMLEEGEYADAATLAKQMLMDNPNNRDAVSVLAIVYEKMADASRDGGDEENEKEFLTLSLSQYLKLLAIDPDSVAEKIKVSKIRKRLGSNVKEELNGDFFRNLWFDLKEKWPEFYENRLAPIVQKKWFRPVSVSLGVAVIALIVCLSVFGGKSEIHEAEVSPSEFENSNINPEYAANMNAYQGPTDTILIENDNAKAQRAEKELEESMKAPVNERQQYMDQGNAQGPAPSQNYAPRQQAESRQTESQNLSVRPLKLPFSGLELKSPEKEEDSNNAETGENIKKENDTPQPVQPQKKGKSANMKQADALMQKALKEQASGNREEAKSLAREAKSLYNRELSEGNGSRRIRTGIETADTIIGD